MWEGLDGSQVGVHFPPADTYNAAADVAAALKTCQNNKVGRCCRASIASVDALRARRGGRTRIG